MKSEDDIVSLKAQSCISNLRNFYETAGKIYGYLSKFAHWGQVIHGQFLDIESGQVAVLSASVRYRARGLALCLVVLDVFIEVIRKLYAHRSDALIGGVQGVLDRGAVRKTHQMISSISELTGLPDLREIQLLLR